MFRILDYVAGAICAAVASAPPLVAQAEPMTLFTVLQRYGVLAAIIAYFVWRDQRREQSMSMRIRELEDFQRNELRKLIEKNTAAMKADGSNKEDKP